ncbi:MULTISPECIES: hypothetical protein [unclassified Bartonella]|uniref:hypothetical protein n=1 Tax=unclassified Bartonella TaxID=2645622 RepID=UPI0035CEFE25
MEKQECGVPIGYQKGLGGYQKGLGGYQKELGIVKIIRRRYRIKVSMILRLLREHQGTVLLLNPNHARYF